MAEFVKTHRGGTALHFEGHKYLKIRESKSGMVFWRCSQHKSGCHARATSEGSSVVVRQDHSHPASQETLAVEKAVSHMRKRAREETISVPRIYDQALQVKFLSIACDLYSISLA